MYMFPVKVGSGNIHRQDAGSKYAHWVYYLYRVSLRDGIVPDTSKVAII